MTQIHITIKSFQWYQIKNTIIFIKKIQSLLNFETTNKVNDIIYMNLPKKRKLFTVLRSPHIDKKSREQFKFTSRKIKLIVKEKNENKNALFVFFLKNSEFPGVELEISLIYNSCLHLL